MGTKTQKHRLSRVLAMFMAIVLSFSSVPGISLAETESNTTSTYTRVDSISSLDVGDTVIIVASDSDVAMSTNQKTNNRGKISVTKSTDGATVTTSGADSSGYSVQEFTLESGSTTGTYAFNTGSGYLYAASSSSNYLKTEETLSDNSSWTITIYGGMATITAQGTNPATGCAIIQPARCFHVMPAPARSRISAFIS